MIHLITQKDIEPRMGLGQTPQGFGVFESAITGAHLRVQPMLDTHLEKGSSEDVFLLDENMTGGLIPGGLFCLRLKNCFVRSTPTVTVFVGDTWDVQEEAVTAFRLNAKKGLLQIPKDYKGSYAKVVYDYGFQNGESLPDELKEALVSMSIAIIKFSSMSKPPMVLIKQMDPVTRAEQHALDILAPLHRNSSLYLNPIY